MEPDIEALTLRPTEPYAEPSPSSLADPQTHVNNPEEVYEDAPSAHHLNEQNQGCSYQSMHHEHPAKHLPHISHSLTIQQPHRFHPLHETQNVSTSLHAQLEKTSSDPE